MSEKKPSKHYVFADSRSKPVSYQTPYPILINAPRPIHLGTNKWLNHRLICCSHHYPTLLSICIKNTTNKTHTN